MSGHLMQTVNPEAAAAEHEVPHPGTRVLYFARPGQTRQGRNICAADVLSSDARKGTATLYVLFGSEDYREIEHVRMRTDQEPYGCWDYVPDSYDAVMDRVEALETAIFGEFERPAKSIINILADFEQRVFAAEGKKPKK
jgi:hypothetical protein